MDETIIGQYKLFNLNILEDYLKEKLIKEKIMVYENIENIVLDNEISNKYKFNIIIKYNKWMKQ